MTKKPVIDITDEDLEVLQPQFATAMEVLRTWPLGRPISELAAVLVLKIIAVTSGQLKEMGFYDRPSRNDSFVIDPFGQL
jgi:hypothetical protein